MLRCIFCGLCEEACPKDAIYLSETFAPADFQRKQFVYSKDELLIPHPLEQPEAYKKSIRATDQKKKLLISNYGYYRNNVLVFKCIGIRQCINGYQC